MLSSLPRGTVSSTALDIISAEFDVPIFGVIDSVAVAALRATKNGRIGVIGTNATIGSGALSAQSALMQRIILMENASQRYTALHARFSYRLLRAVLSHRAMK